MNKAWIPLLGVFIAALALNHLAHAVEKNSFYEGKTVKFIVPYTPGGLYDLHTRLLSRHMGKHIPGKPKTLVQNLPGAGGAIGMNYLYNVARPDGLTLAVVSKTAYLDQLAGRKGLKFDYQRFAWIGSIGRTAAFLLCRTDSPYTSVEKLKGGVQRANIGITGTGDIGFQFGTIAKEAIGIDLKFVSGYRGGVDVDAALQRGEVDCRALGVSVLRGREPWRSWIKPGGFMTLVLQQGPQREPDFPRTPTLYELSPASARSVLEVADVLFGYSQFDRPFATSPDVPKDKLEILRQAFLATTADPAYQNEAKKLGFDTRHISGQELESVFQKLLSPSPEVHTKLKKILKGEK